MVRRGHLITVVGTFMIGCVVVVVGCSWVRSEAPKEEQASGSITVGSIGSRLPDSSVLRINGITYDGKLVGQQLREEDLGPEVAEVTPVVNEQGTTSTNNNDGAASNLVPVYAVEGYDTSFRLAARLDYSLVYEGLDGHWLIMFEALSNPKANEASDLLDIGGKVSSISINDRASPDSELGTIKDFAEVERLVRELMDAPLEQTGPDYYETKNIYAKNPYLIVFHLKDGTVVTSYYRTDTGRLANSYSNLTDSSYSVESPASAIVTPQPFRDAVEEVVNPEPTGPPDSTLSYGGREVRSSVSGSLLWGQRIADGAPATPPPKETLTVPSGAEMVFRYEGQRPQKVSVSTQTGSPRSLKAYGSGLERTIPAELPPGEYGVDVYVMEPKGEFYYTFRVTVE